MSDAPDLSSQPPRPGPSVVRVMRRAHGGRGWACLPCLSACSLRQSGRASRGPLLDPPWTSRDGFGKRCGTIFPGGGGGFGRRARFMERAPSGRQGGLRSWRGECGTMTQARRETPGGAGGVANDAPCSEVVWYAISGLKSTYSDARAGRPLRAGTAPLRKRPPARAL